MFIFFFYIIIYIIILKKLKILFNNIVKIFINMYVCEIKIYVMRLLKDMN